MRNFISDSLLLYIVSILLTMNSHIYSQQNINEIVDQKLKVIDGEVTKITIEKGDQVVEFTKEEAAHLFERMKPGKLHFQISTDGDRCSSMVRVEEFCTGDDTKTKIKIEVEDGSKIVTVTTVEDGEETTKILEGEEADLYLEKYKVAKDHIYMLKKNIDEEFGEIEIDINDEVILLKRDDAKLIQILVDDESQKVNKYIIKKKMKKADDE